MKCPQCGNENGDNLDVCNNCGAQLTPSDPAAPADSNSTNSEASAPNAPGPENSAAPADSAALTESSNSATPADSAASADSAAPTESTDSAAPVDPAKKSEPDKKSKATPLFICIALAVVIVVAVVAICLLRAKLSDDSNKLSSNDLQEGEKTVLAGFEIDTGGEDDDFDEDGLTKKQEDDLGTNYTLADTDGDGLDDGYEVETSKTDPLKVDTDGDSLEDFVELLLGLDPTKKDSKGDGVEDGARELSYSYNGDGVKIQLNGRGNLAKTRSIVSENPTFKKMDGFLPEVYTFSTAGELASAQVEITLDPAAISEKGLNMSELTLYNFDFDTKKLTAVQSSVNESTRTLTATLEHFSHYIIGSNNAKLTSTDAEVLFIIDNSASMYTEEQLSNAGYTSTGAIGNDKDFKRLTLTNLMIDQLTGNYKFSVSEFSGNYKQLSEFSTDKSAVKSSVDSMNTNWQTNTDGTNIGNALQSGLDDFDKTESDAQRYIVILTDGKDTEGNFDTKAKTIIKNAQSMDIKICSIGLGHDIDTEELVEISEATGCAYYNASDSNALDEIYELISTDINYGLVDTKDDNLPNAILLADSGFLASRDGFSFENYGTNLSPNGHCYGMALFAELYYLNKMPLRHGSATITGDDKTYAYNLSGTVFEDHEVNLYDYKLKTNELKYTFGYEHFGETKPADLRTVDGTTLTFSEPYLSTIKNSGIYDLSIVASGLTPEQRVEKWGMDYEDALDILLNEDNMQTAKVMDETDKNLFNSIYFSFMGQDVANYYASSRNLRNMFDQFFLESNEQRVFADTFLGSLQSRLSSGDAPVMSGQYYGGKGLHAINAISLSVDKDNPDLYYIGVYDNNFPGEKRYVAMKCGWFSCTSKANNYYKGDGTALIISKSLALDLEYFNRY